MRRIVQLWIGAILITLGLAGISGAQSLGDYARSVRKDKPQPSVARKHYDNDNLPKTQHLSVVGQPPAQPAESAQPKADELDADGKPKIDATGPSTDPVAAPKDEEAEREKKNDEWRERLADQKKKVDAAEKELDLLNREYRLRAAAMYADVGNRLRNSAAWDKEDRDYKQQVADKQKEIAEAKQKLDEMQEQARKAGVPASARE